MNNFYFIRKADGILLLGLAIMKFSIRQLYIVIISYTKLID
jgi:hypothetical protein